MTPMHKTPGAAGAVVARDHALHPPALVPAYRSTALRAPRRPLVPVAQSPTEARGPAFGPDAVEPGDADLLTNFAAPGQSAVGERIVVTGTLRDGDGHPVPGALIEIWQANAGGRYRHARDDYLAPLDPNFGGCGRCMTDAAGRYAFRSVKPGPYPWPNGPNDWRPAHIHLSVFGTAWAQRLITQFYFEGDPHIPLCPILGGVADAAAVDRLTARMDRAGTIPFDAVAWRFDITLRGRRQTPFETAVEGM